MPNKYSPPASQVPQPGMRDDQRAIAEAIARSWRRCMVKGVDEQAPAEDQIMTAQELAQRLEKNRLLLTHAEPEMLTLSEQIAHTRSLVILTDSEGVILRTRGEGVEENQIRASLLPGASWSEEHRGTNAIGTALVERLPISVQGAEHFMAYHHSLSCSAVPIFAANNHLVATLDVSNDLNAPQQHTLALVKMAAQMVENRLFHATAEGEIGVHFHVRPEFIGTLWEGVALFDAQGQLQAINRSGQFQFGLPLDQDVLSARRIETPQFFWMRVAMGLFIQEEKDREDWVVRLYNLYKSRRFCSSTPTLFNSGTPHSQLSSCYLYKVDDNIESIMIRGIAENAFLSKWAGGLGGSWTSVRGTGGYIKGTNGESQGVIPFLKLHNDQLVAVNQGGKRRGSGCAYLESWHNDIHDFLQLRINTGDELH